MTDSKTFNDPQDEQAADDAKVETPDGKDFGHAYAPLDPSTHENDPALSTEQKAERSSGKVEVDTSASLRTSDSDDKSKDWTVQATDKDKNPVALTEDLGEPGQRFRWEELPYAESVEKWGVDSKTWPTALPLHEDAGKKVYDASDDEDDDWDDDETSKTK